MGAQSTSSNLRRGSGDSSSSAAMTMYAMSDLQYQAVYNCLSFALASMMATTMYLWFRSTAVADKYKSAVLISGLVTFIAAYHYIRIFNSWVDAYHYSVGKVEGGALEMQAPTLTGIPFNDAYRYMDWLLTVPLLLIEILLVMKLDDATFSSKAWNLGVGSALMIASGYYGELVVSGDLTPRWMCWFISMIFFLYIVNAARRSGVGVDTEKKMMGGQNKSAHSGAGANAVKLDENTETFKHETVSHDFKMALQQARLAKKMSQAALATAINEKGTVINEYESGKAIPNGAIINKLNRP